MKNKSITQLKKQLWELTKQIIRKRYGNTCYTCGAKDLIGSNWHTSHFIPSSIGGASLRYHFDNLRPACYNCNINKSGNWPAFLENLRAEIGNKRVNELLKLKNKTSKADRYFYTTKIKEYQEIVDNLAK